MSPHPCHARRNTPLSLRAQRSNPLSPPRLSCAAQAPPLSLRAQRSNPFFVFVFHNVSLGYCVPCAYPRICSNCAIACFHILGFIASVTKQSSFPTCYARHRPRPCHCERSEAIQFSPLSCAATPPLSLRAQRSNPVNSVRATRDILQTWIATPSAMARDDKEWVPQSHCPPQ